METSDNKDSTRSWRYPHIVFKRWALWREQPGMISEGACWCLSYDIYFHANESLWGLAKEVVTEYKDERHLW